MMKHVPGKIKDKYKILGIIGEGAYGVVLKARRRDSSTIVAIKYFKSNPGYSGDIDVIERELNILQSLRFENVVELIEWFRDKKQCFLVFEYVEWNMLQVLQQHPQGLQIEQVRHLSYQLFNAINCCHTHGILHRDIKPENLLISKNLTLKLCDFGFARFCNTLATADHYTDYVATRWYRSPELLIGSPYGKPVDVWACGCIMAELSTGQALFAGESDIDQLYRIQKCLGPLPMKYMEAMKSNPKFQGLKFPSIHHFETLERRFGHIFPPEIMHLFKNTLRLYATDRYTAERCLQHEAFMHLNQKRLSRAHQRPKSVYSSINTSQPQMDYRNESIHHATPFLDNRLSKSYDDPVDSHVQHRSPDDFTDISFATSPVKYRSNEQSSPSHRHQPKIIQTQSRTHSSSSNEQTQPSVFSPRTSNDASDNDDEQNNQILQRKSLKSQQGTREQQVPPSPSLRFASNGVLLRPKPQQQQQQPIINVLSMSSNDMGKTFKRFSLDQQHIPEQNIYRSSMVLTPNHAVQMNNPAFKPLRDEMNNDSQQQRAKSREMHRDSARRRTTEFHVPIETTPILQRAPSRQSVFGAHQMVPDSTYQFDADSSASITSRNLEAQSTNKFSWNAEQRRPIYGSDSHLLNSNGHVLSFHRPFPSPTKTDSSHKPVIPPPRDSTNEPIKSAKFSSKQPTPVVYPKTTNEPNRKQQSNNNASGVYPFARTAILHVAHALIPSSYQRQQSARFQTSKSRHQDH